MAAMLEQNWQGHKHDSLVMIERNVFIINYNIVLCLARHLYSMIWDVRTILKHKKKE